MAYTANVREIIAQLKAADEDEYNRLLDEYGQDPRASVGKAMAAARRRLDAEAAERRRVEKLYSIMREAGDDKIVVGIDEVGRGSLAGPLTVAAVILPNNPIILGLNDSKQLSPKQREEVAVDIRSHARGIGIAHIPPATIDESGMSASLRMAMSEALDKLDIEPDLVLIDGNPVHVHPKERCIVKGDAKVACISVASIVAKVTRDHLMIEADSKYPGYYFAQSKGYGSSQHIQAIKELGLTDFHRKSFCGNFLQESLF